MPSQVRACSFNLSRCRELIFFLPRVRRFALSTGFHPGGQLFDGVKIMVFFKPATIVPEIFSKKPHQKTSAGLNIPQKPIENSFEKPPNIAPGGYALKNQNENNLSLNNPTGCAVLMGSVSGLIGTKIAVILLFPTKKRIKI